MPDANISHISTAPSAPTSSTASLRPKEADELLLLRQVARTACAMLNAPYLDHATRLRELLKVWQVDMRGS